MFQVNFFASIMLARGLVEELRTAHGAVVNVTSIAGSRVHPFAGAAYATSKAALMALTRASVDFHPLAYALSRGAVVVNLATNVNTGGDAAPTVSLTAPAANAVVTGPAVPLSFT